MNLPKTESDNFYEMVAKTMCDLENQASRWISTGKKLADETKSLRSKAKILMIEVDLYLVIVRLLDSLKVAEIPLELRTAIVQRQDNAIQILEDAERLCSESEAIAKQALGGQELEAFLKGVTALRQMIHARKQLGSITVEEKKVIFQALMTSPLNVDL